MAVVSVAVIATVLVAVKLPPFLQQAGADKSECMVHPILAPEVGVHTCFKPA